MCITFAFFALKFLKIFWVSALCICNGLLVYKNRSHSIARALLRPLNLKLTKDMNCDTGVHEFESESIFKFYKKKPELLKFT